MTLWHALASIYISGSVKRCGNFRCWWVGSRKSAVMIDGVHFKRILYTYYWDIMLI